MIYVSLVLTAKYYSDFPVVFFAFHGAIEDTRSLDQSIDPLINSLANHLLNMIILNTRRTMVNKDI